jgi:crotonobetainyl-CoA:carnitine CoA-transferase CaiB-like acyl-CoA transferase
MEIAGLRGFRYGPHRKTLFDFAPRSTPVWHDCRRNAGTMMDALEGILVVALEQAVAVPSATCKLADAGARVIKLERAEGDFARGYDDYAKGLSSYFVWLNRGKESCRVDLKQADDRAMV